MATIVLTLRIPEETKVKLDKLAQAMHRSKSFLAEEAIARYLELEVWQSAKSSRQFRKPTGAILHPRPTAKMAEGIRRHLKPPPWPANA